MNYFIQCLLSSLLISGSIALGFFMTSVFFTKINTEACLDEIKDEGYSLYSFLDELENEPMSNLSESELRELKTKEVCIKLAPLLSHDVVMFYDHENEMFAYYSESDVIYKYLDIIARYYVLTYHCKQIYTEIESSTLKTFTQEMLNGPFVSKKSEKKFLEKKCLKFIYKGNIHDSLRDKPPPREENPINILEFLKRQKNEEYEYITNEVMKEE